MLRIWRLRLPEGCAVYSDVALEVKARPPHARLLEISRVPGVRREGILLQRHKTSSWPGLARHDPLGLSRPGSFKPRRRCFRLHPLKLRQLMPKPGELPFGVMAGVGAADLG